MTDLKVELTTDPEDLAEKPSEVVLTAQLTVLVDGPIDVAPSFVHGAEKIPGVEQKGRVKGSVVSAAHTVAATKENAGEWTVSAKNGDADLELVGEKTVTIAEAAEDQEDEDDDTAKPAPVLRDLVWDPAFAKSTSRFFMLVMVFFCTLFSIGAFKYAGGSDNAVASFTGALLMLAGVLSITTGAWIILLELRGRSPESWPKTKGDAQTRSGTTTRSGMTETIGAITDATTKWAKVLRTMRGPLALLAAGVTLALVAAAMLGSNFFDSSDDDQEGTSSFVDRDRVELVV